MKLAVQQFAKNALKKYQINRNKHVFYLFVLLKLHYETLISALSTFDLKTFELSIWQSFIDICNSWNYILYKK